MTSQTLIHLGSISLRSRSIASVANNQAHSVILKHYWASQISKRKIKMTQLLKLKTIIITTIIHTNSQSVKNIIKSEMNQMASMHKHSRLTMSKKLKS